MGYFWVLMPAMRILGFLCGSVLETLESAWSQELFLKLHFLSGPIAFPWTGCSWERTLLGLMGIPRDHPLSDQALIPILPRETDNWNSENTQVQALVSLLPLGWGWEEAEEDHQLQDKEWAASFYRPPCLPCTLLPYSFLPLTPPHTFSLCPWPWMTPGLSILQSPLPIFSVHCFSHCMVTEGRDVASLIPNGQTWTLINRF